MDTFPFTTPRSRKQLTLFLAGASFFTLSTLITRRAIYRKHLWPTPKFYQPSNSPPPIPINGTVEAVEALQLATVNVLSFMMMVTGGVAWGFDVSSVEEARRRIPVRKGKGVGEAMGDAGGEGDGEDELPDWIVGMVKGGGKEGERRRDERRREKRATMDELGQAKERIDSMEKEGADEKSRPWWRPW